ncbi:MAG: zinc ribbon domain-containing protein [Candidatus Aegiribacteria sp.]|nr:zinc ribbon domain-containing protein [Candidatus Aegiribacteria sp.]
MPTYEYRCSNCGHRFDEFHQMKDTAERKCPECGSKAERMMGTGSGIIFKGAGFYATDYAKPKHADKPDSCPSGTCCCKDS